ncbi:MAG: fibronectin type III domain-containing protein [Thermodesulfobacteriota bacterium]
MRKRPCSPAVVLVLILVVTCLDLAGGTPATAGPDSFDSRVFLASFDELPVTGAAEIPGDGGDWLYTTASSHPDPTLPMTTNDWAGWRSTVPYPAPHDGIAGFFYQYLNTYNSAHMGFSTYGFLEIDGEQAVRGHSLRFRVTGGVNSTGTHGELVTSKEHYLDLLAQGIDPVAHGVRVGHPYLYFANNSPASAPAPFPEAQGANRLSVYYHAPATLTNGPGGSGMRPEPTVNLGPYNGDGGHWYHEICNQGGGWTHVLVDGHPQHNNAWSGAESYPYPSRSLRDMGVAYFNGWYRWYLTFKPYEGIGDAPYDVWLDEVAFRHDPEPQNNETIATPAVTWLPASRSFEIGFMDKYKNNPYSYSTYELRYAFAPITNATWDHATPAHILADERFAIAERTDGRFAKHWPYYQSVWAPFTLASFADLDRLTAGTVIHFAVKDISQIGGDSPQPITDTGIGRWSVGGRDYAGHGDLFDYAGDQPALPLIKRIDFQLPGEPAPVSPWPPAGLSARAVSPTRVVLAWTDNADNEMGFLVETKKGGCAAAQPWRRIAVKETDAAFHLQTGLPPGTAFAYRVRTFNQAGGSAPSNCASTVTGREGTPATPRGLEAWSASTTTVQIAWTDSSADETGFQLFRKAGAGPWTILRTLAANATRHRDTTALGNHAGTSYAYQVQACNSAGCSPATAAAVVPFAPTGLTATAQAGQVTLTWTPPADEEDGFQVFRKDGGCRGPGWSLAASASPDAETASDTQVTGDVTYSYIVRAWTGSPPPAAWGYSLVTNCASVTVVP